MNHSPLSLFEAFGIELEYMLVDRETLDVRSQADTLLSELSGRPGASDYESGPVTWSNELARHVVELKTTLPRKKLRSLPSTFETAIAELTPTLDRLNLRLMPTAMHPWMNPAEETQLWPHENHEIYTAFDRVFDCRRHGWGNVQSVHLNLPFSGDDEFARLHAAVRLLLPILPALAASSPIVDGQATGRVDTRMEFYASHCDAVPTLVGPLIPEPIFDEASYRQQIFAPIAEQMRGHDPAGVMDVEFLNARAAIARFDRGSIEIRVMDVQEYPGADVAICAAVIAVLKALVAELPSSLATQQQLGTDRLRAILDAVVVGGERTMIEDAEYFKALGAPVTSCRAGELWRILLERVRRDDTALSTLYAPIEIICEHGTLATRIRKSLGKKFTRDDLHSVYDQLADCLVEGHPFRS
jgi:gamma-glutamyl:cysteine ligase YbdK (ATP-grasp superfamily)